MLPTHPQHSMRAQAAQHGVKAKQLQSWLRRFHATSHSHTNSYLDHRSVDSPPAIPFYMPVAPSPFKLPVSLIRSQQETPVAHSLPRTGLLDHATGDVARADYTKQWTPLVSHPAPDLKDDTSRRERLAQSAEEKYDVGMANVGIDQSSRRPRGAAHGDLERQRPIRFSESPMEAVSLDYNPQRDSEQARDFYTIGTGSPEQEQATKALERNIRKVGNPKLAWRLYQQFKEHHAPHIRMWDYHKVVISFVAIHQPELALRVLKDSVPSSGPRIPKHARTEYCRRLVQLQLVSTTKSDIDAVSRCALSFFRSPAHQRSFYGRWLKKLIGMRERHAAAELVTEMMSKGNKPSTKQLTGLIEAFLNSENPEDREKGEQEAFKMIDLRIRQVQLARTTAEGGASSPEPPPSKAKDGILPAHPTAPSPADIDTFSLLAAYYLKERRLDQALWLQERLLRSADIPINTRLLNTLLKALLYADKPRRAWRLIQRCKETAQPSLETFAVFWTIMVRSYDRTRPSKRDDLPSPRALFKFMARYFEDFEPQTPIPSVQAQQPVQSPQAPDDPAQPPQPAQATQLDVINKQALKLLGRNRDFFGCIVAMYGFKSCFGVLPKTGYMEHVAQHVAQLGSKQPRDRRQRERLLASPQHKRNLYRVIWTLRLLHRQRGGAGGAASFQGGSGREFDPRGEELFQLLVRFLQAVYKRSYVGLDVERELEAAKRSMGSGDLPMEDFDFTEAL